MVKVGILPIYIEVVNKWKIEFFVEEKHQNVNLYGGYIWTGDFNNNPFYNADRYNVKQRTLEKNFNTWL